jgi:hypothetical protein
MGWDFPPLGLGMDMGVKLNGKALYDVTDNMLKIHMKLDGEASLEFIFKVVFESYINTAEDGNSKKDRLFDMASIASHAETMALGVIAHAGDAEDVDMLMELYRKRATRFIRELKKIREGKEV